MDQVSVKTDSPERAPDEPMTIAKAVEKDFGELVQIFERQAKGADGDERSAIARSQAAAERGLDLSRQLVELLRAASSAPRD